MPYSLKGNSVVKSDSGEVVKTHPTREKALAHLKALKANVEEGSPAVLGALLEGFDSAAHPRDFHGRWRKGDKVHVVTPQGIVERGVVEKPAESYDAITSRGTERSTTVTVKWADGDVTHERPKDLSAGHPARRLPTSRRATLGKAEGDAAARTRAEILAKSPGAAADLARHQSIASGARRTPAFDPITMLGREGTAARARGASSKTVLHADIRDKLTNLPQGQRYTLAGPRGQVGHVHRTASGFEVYTHGSGPEKVHKTPSAAAAHAMKLERTAFEGTPKNADVMARNYRHGQEVRAMNARQSQRAEAEAERQLEITAQTASSSRERALAQTELERRRGARTARPRVRESAGEVLGVLLEAFDEGKHRRGFHGRFIGSWDPGKFGDEGLSTRVGGLKAGKTLKFKGSDVKVLAHANHYEVYHPVLKHWSGASSASEASNKAINFHRQATQKVRESAPAPEALGALLEGR